METLASNRDHEFHIMSLLGFVYPSKGPTEGNDSVSVCLTRNASGVLHREKACIGKKIHGHQKASSGFHKIKKA